MNLIKRNTNSWYPFALLNDLQTDWDNAFGRLVPAENFVRGFDPQIEIREESDHYAVRADLPGIDKSELKVTVDDNVLAIQGERRESKEKKTEGYQYSERVYGSFFRSVRLPGEVDADKIKAEYRDGVLDVSLPKSAKVKAKQIAVEVK